MCCHLKLQVLSAFVEFAKFIIIVFDFNLQNCQRNKIFHFKKSWQICAKNKIENICKRSMWKQQTNKNKNYFEILLNKN